MIRCRWFARSALLLGLILFATASAAQGAPSTGLGTVACNASNAATMGVFNCISSQFFSASQSWAAKLTGYATNLFALLAAIEFAWAGITYALEKDSPNTLLAMFAKKLMTIGFFYVLLLKGPGWMQDVVTSCQQAGESAGGVQGISPTSIVGIGMNCAWAIYGGLSDLGIADRIGLALPCGIAALLTMIAFVIVAGQMFVTLVESYIVTGAGILFLGFGASRFTSDFTKKYITYGVSVGVKLFVITLIVGVGQQFTGTWAQMLNNSPGDVIHASMIVAGGALLYAMVAWQIPSFAQSLMSGAANLSAGTAMASTAGVAGVAAGVAMGGAAAVTGGLTSIAGAAQAMNAGIGLARAGGASGASAMLQGVGKAVGGMAREAASSSGFGATFGNSVGGRTATSINERAAALKSASVVPPPANASEGDTRPSPDPTGGSPTGATETPITNGGPRVETTRQSASQGGSVGGGLGGTRPTYAPPPSAIPADVERTPAYVPPPEAPSKPISIGKPYEPRSAADLVRAMPHDGGGGGSPPEIRIGHGED